MESQVTNPLAGLPEDVYDDVVGLMWLGYLEDSFSYGGHNFIIRTLRGDEDLLIGLVTKDYAETITQAKATVWATIALALVAVDGDEDFCPPLGRDKKAYAHGRFKYCTSNWFWPLALAIYNHYAALLDRQATAIRAIEDLSTGSLDLYTPSPSSLIDKASSPSPTEPGEDIRDFLDPEEDSTDSNSSS